MSALRRSVWRFEAGLLRSQELRAMFADAFSGLIEHYAAARRDWEEYLHTRHPVNVTSAEFDRALLNGRLANRAGQWRETLGWHERAAAASASLILAAAASRSIKAAERRHCDLLAALRGGDPAMLPTNNCIARLKSTAVILFSAAEYRQARFVAEQCLRENEHLLAERSDVSAIAPALQARIARLGVLRDRRPDATNLESKGLEIFRFLAAVEAAVASCRPVLAERLLDDIEAATAPLVALTTEMERQDTTREVTVSAAIAAQVAAGVDSWEEAADRLIEVAVTTLSGKLTALQLHENVLGDAAPWPHIRIYRD
ncbi:MAG: hypothetical protein JWM95_4280 [Gemmatimonadetes bacterium]|nr:hypothetical protein [Gemmatimonadota bacterium]